MKKDHVLKTLSILFSVFSFYRFYEKNRLFSVPLLEDFNSLTKYLFRFCGIKKEITKIVVLNVVFFSSLEMSLYDSSANMYSSVLNCLPHKVHLKGPKFGAVLCKKKKFIAVSQMDFTRV